MRPNLLAAGIENVDQFAATVKDRTDDEVAGYTDWLGKLGEAEYKEFMAIWGLKSPEWWANMAMLGETDLREHRLLRPLAKKLRAAWRKNNRKPRVKKTDAA